MDWVQVSLFDTAPTVYRCEKDATRWLTPNTPCPMCVPSQETAVCDACGDTFTDSRRMIEHMRIGENVRCARCFPRVSFDDCRDQDALHREAEDIRQDQVAFERKVRGIRPIAFYPIDD